VPWNALERSFTPRTSKINLQHVAAK
jgi:hypothetical protein